MEKVILKNLKSFSVLLILIWMESLVTQVMILILILEFLASTLDQGTYLKKEKLLDAFRNFDIVLWFINCRMGMGR
jgi:hypothetical protein